MYIKGIGRHMKKYRARILVVMCLALVLAVFNNCGKGGGGSAGMTSSKITVTVNNFTRLVGSPNSSTHAYDVAADLNGNSYLTGITLGNLDGQRLTGPQDFFVSKFDKSGVKKWTRLLGATGAYSTALSVTTDPSGNIFVTGSTDGSLEGFTKTGRDDGFVTKFNSEGTKLWTKQFGSTGAYVSPKKIISDSFGYIYVMGDTTGALNGEVLNGFSDVFIIKFDSDGRRIWTKLSGLTSGSSKYVSDGRDIKLSSSGNIYITGVTNGPLDGQSIKGSLDAFLIKYNAEGIKQWTQLIGAEDKETQATGLAVHSDNQIYLIGYTQGRDSYLMKVNNVGVKEWTKSLGLHSTVRGQDIEVDSGGNVYIIGTTFADIDGQILNVGRDNFVTKTNSEGTKISTRLLGAIGDYDVSIDIDKHNNVYLSGSTNGFFDGEYLNGSPDAFITTKFSFEQ